jgi:hypothetical protein
VVVSDSHEAGAMAFGAGSRVVVEESLIRRTQSQTSPDGQYGMGVLAFGGGVAEVSRTVLSGTQDAAAATYVPSSRLTLRDVLIDGAAVQADRVTVLDAIGAAIITASTNRALQPTWTGRDLFVRRVTPIERADGSGRGFGVMVDRNALVVLERLWVEDAAWGFAVFNDPPGALTVQDAVFVGVAHAGALVTDDATLDGAATLTRVRVTGGGDRAVRRDATARSLRDGL